MFHKINRDAKVEYVYGKQYHSCDFLLHLEDDYYVSNHNWITSGDMEYTILRLIDKEANPSPMNGIASFTEADKLALSDAFGKLKLITFKKELDEII